MWSYKNNIFLNRLQRTLTVYCEKSLGLLSVFVYELISNKFLSVYDSNWVCLLRIFLYLDSRFRSLREFMWFGYSGEEPERDLQEEDWSVNLKGVQHNWLTKVEGSLQKLLVIGYKCLQQSKRGNLLLFKSNSLLLTLLDEHY